MNLVRLIGGAALIAAAVIPANRPAESALDGQAILARLAVPGLRSYRVPATFRVRMRKPLPVGGTVGGMVYYRAPGDAAMVITNARGLIGRFFRGTYRIDLAPQGWAAKYHVTSVAGATVGGRDAYLLRVVPRAAGDLSAVTFAVAKGSYAPLQATWTYRDGSSIRIDLPPTRSPYLPPTETVVVRKPQYALQADCTFGAYATNVAIPKEVFAPR